MNGVDRVTVYKLGIAASEGNMSAVDKMVEYYNLSDDFSDKRDLLAEFNEGVRNYSDSQDRVNEVITYLRSQLDKTSE